MQKSDEDSGRRDDGKTRLPFDRGLRHARIFAERNRGILLDLLMFLGNLFLMRYLSAYFIDIYRNTSDADRGSRIAFALCCIAMMTLPASAAVLKRWHYHRRLAAAGNSGESRGMLLGCLCNPIFYFCLNLVIMAAVMTIGGEVVFGERFRTDGGLFVGSILLGMVMTGVQTFLVYRYFSAPKAPPRSRFLLNPASEKLADLFIFINMALFQAAWNIVMFVPMEPVSSLLDLAGRLFFLSFIALLIYFPPRIFYLAEDIDRPGAWGTMVLANLPVIVRVFGGI